MFILTYCTFVLSQQFLFFGLSTTEEISLVEMRIWFNNIDFVFVLHSNPWVEASAGGLEVPEVSTAH
jgi:hypothetical protein